ncbi:MAG: hypothetical protein H6598_03015 [Flavobacteriales bacterium]|nr:hypothetical protein [Flavobacteriales bacterium]
MKKLITSIILLLLALNYQAQDLSYLNKIGQKLVDDILNGTTTAYAHDSVVDAFLTKGVISQLKEEKTDAEKKALIDEVNANYKDNYEQTVKSSKTLLDDTGFYMDELALYSNVPLTVEVVESQYNSESGMYDYTKDDLAALKCIFMIGDLDKRVIFDVTVIMYNSTYSIMEIKKPVKYLTFLPKESIHGIMYSKMSEILEKKVLNTNFVSSFIDGNPLIGKKYDDEWNTCTVQLFDENNPTLIKLEAQGESILSGTKATIKASLFEEISADEGLEQIKEFLCIVAQQFVYYADEQNGLSSDKKVVVNTNQAYEIDTKNNTITASLELRNHSDNKLLYTFKLFLFANKKGSFNMDLFLVEG